MNGGSSTVTCPSNEQLIGKFHVTNIEKPTVINPSDEIIIPRTASIPDETGCASRFQMIRVDRNFGRGRWKVNDYEPPENTAVSTNPLVNTNENESMNNSTFSNVQQGVLPVTSTNLPTVMNGDSNVATSAALTATAASVAVATATAFQQQQQQQQRMALNNTPTVVPSANVPPSTGLLHGYPSGPLPNQSYILPNHHPQYGYYHFYPPPYSHYAPPWAAALAASNPYLQPPTMAPPQQQTNSQLSSNTNLTDPLRVSEIDNNVENTFPNPSADPLQNAQLAAYLFALQHSHPSYVQQPSSTASTYATIPSYHPVPSPHPTILPPQTLSLSQNLLTNITDIQQSYQAPVLTSPKTDGSKTLSHQSSLTTPKTKPLVPTGFNGMNNDPTKTTHISELISSSPALAAVQPAPPSFISPINISAPNTTAASLSDLWSYTTAGSPLSLTQTAQTAAVTAVTAMGLLNNDTSQNKAIANEILKELTTPTKQNNTADIDNKISAAMDLVKMHLLSAVREEVTELRQQIRALNEKINSAEHENAFLRQHVPSEIYAQYNPANAVLSSSNDSTNSSTNPIPSVLSSQPIPMTSLSSIPSVLTQQTSLTTNPSQAILSTPNLP